VSWLEGGRVLLATEGPEAGSLEDRAARTFRVMAVVGVAGIILSLLPDSFPNSALLTVAFNWAAALSSVLFFVEARAIGEGRPWAIAASRPLLILLGAWSAYAAVEGFLGGVIRLPFELVLVAWAFRGGPGFAGRAADVSSGSGGRVSPFERRSLAVIGAAALLLGTMAFGYLVFGWGGLLDVDQEDLIGSLRVDCGDPAAGVPEHLSVAYDWSWSRAAPLPNEVDTVVLGWSGDDAEGRPLYVFGEKEEDGSAIRPGQRGKLGGELVSEVRAMSNGGFQWAVDLNRRGYQPGGVTLVLMRAREVTGPVSLTVKAAYVHLGQWHAETAPVTCTW